MDRSLLQLLCDGIAETEKAGAQRDRLTPTSEYFVLGVRVAEVPEPATLSLLALGGLVAIRRRR